MHDCVNVTRCPANRWRTGNIWGSAACAEELGANFRGDPVLQGSRKRDPRSEYLSHFNGMDVSFRPSISKQSGVSRVLGDVVFWLLQMWRGHIHFLPFFICLLSLYFYSFSHVLLILQLVVYSCSRSTMEQLLMKTYSCMLQSTDSNICVLWCEK